MNERVNDRAFTVAIKGLFEVLKSWGKEGEGEGNHAQSIILELTGFHSSDGIDYKRAGFPLLLLVGRHFDILRCRYKHSFLRILDPQDLPILACISHFRAYFQTLH